MHVKTTKLVMLSRDKTASFSLFLTEISLYGYRPTFADMCQDVACCDHPLLLWLCSPRFLSFQICTNPFSLKTTDFADILRLI